MNKKSQKNHKVITVTNDPIITRKACNFLITELIKYLITQKRMIPYPFDTLQYYVSKRKSLDIQQDDDNTKRILRCIESEKYFKQTAEAVSTITALLEGTSSAIFSAESQLSEIALLFGSTQVNPRLVVHIVLPSFNLQHSDNHHSIRNPLDNLLKIMLIDDELNRILSDEFTINSKMFVLLKIKGEFNDESYSQRENFSLPDKGQLVTFTFNNVLIPASNVHCKCVLPFEDGSDECDTSSSENVSKTVSENQPQSEDSCSTECLESLSLEISNDKPLTEHSKSDVPVHHWYQHNQSLKAFQNAKVKGASIVNFWVHPETF